MSGAERIGAGIKITLLIPSTVMSVVVSSFEL